jgi:hypothetical protein
MLLKTTVLESSVKLECGLLNFVSCGSPFPENQMLPKTTVLESPTPRPRPRPTPSPPHTRPSSLSPTPTPHPHPHRHTHTHTHTHTQDPHPHTPTPSTHTGTHTNTLTHIHIHICIFIPQSLPKTEHRPCACGAHVGISPVANCHGLSRLGPVLLVLAVGGRHVHRRLPGRSQRRSLRGLHRSLHCWSGPTLEARCHRPPNRDAQVGPAAGIRASSGT